MFLAGKQPPKREKADESLPTIKDPDDEPELPERFNFGVKKGDLGVKRGEKWVWKQEWSPKGDWKEIFFATFF